MIHPIVRAAAAGELPAWAEAGPTRRAHMARVATLMEGWARELKTDEEDTVRWRAVAMLHDALRDADPEALLVLVGPDAAGMPAPLLHGPAAAARLRAERVQDEHLLLAVAWHSTGHPDLDTMGRALYLADYLEPGRKGDSAIAAARRAGVAADMDGTLQALVHERIEHSLAARHPLLDPTVRFWNSLVHA